MAHSFNLAMESHVNEGELLCLRRISKIVFAHHKLEEHCNHWVGHPKHWTTLHHSSFQATHPDDARAAEAAILYGSGARGPGARGQGPFPQIPHEPHGTGCESLSFFRPEIELEPLQPNSISKGSQHISTGQVRWWMSFRTTKQPSNC